jgi:sodium transport system ATP-binding protein
MIEARGLSKRYGEVVAASDVSFTVSAGEVVGLLGPNGAGKTTVLRMLAGVLTPSSGEVRVAGHGTEAEAFELKRSLGFLTGDTALYQRLTPREVLRYFGRLHEIPEAALSARIDTLVGRFRLTEFADRPCGKLSSGQKQRANIARAFIHDPPALILDEPTTALDVVTGRFLLEAFREARTAGKAILLSTHVLGDAEALCDRVVLLHRGKVLDQGTVAEVCTRAGARTLTDAFLARVGDEVTA